LLVIQSHPATLGRTSAPSNIERRAQAVNEMGIQICMRDAASLLRIKQNTEQNDFRDVEHGL
jgi:hypothetical protein